jgi:anaerobic magnesium-protoporphyrin IX monomethyl ester cyclase
MTSILLTTLNAKYIHLNLAIRILYDLNKDHANLEWKEFVIKNDFNEVAEYCSKYDIVCFSCYIWNITQTLEVCKIIKQLNSNTKVLLGGPEVSYEWEPVIATEYVDYIIVGEGEIPFQEFVKNYPNVNNVPNLIYKTDTSIHYNKQNVSFDIQNLANKNPYQYEPVEDLGNKVCYIETSRGCPYKCEFCLASLDNKVRYLPMDTIKSNLLYLMQHGKTIKFLDRTFNVKKDFTLELFQFILDHHRAENVFQFEITADIVHPDIIAFIREKVPKNLFRFEIGIQTVNQESNRAVSRKQNFEKTSNVIKQLDDIIEMHLDLIVGLPLEYLEDLKYSFEATFKLFPPELQLGFLKFLKGTPVREKYEEHGYVFDPNPPYQIIKSNFLSEQELKSIEMLEDALEIYWNKKRTINTLKYIANNYSIFDYLLGLGAYFHKVSNTHKHTLKDIFEIIYTYTKCNYNDKIILELIALDYYTYHKVKPTDLYQIEVNKATRGKLLEDLKLDHHHYRFAMLPIENDEKHIALNNHTITHQDKKYFIIQFDGQQNGQLI